VTLTPFDDYPIHQTALPVAHPASGDKNHYDRYFFNGYDVDGEWFFAVAMGVYPNRNVIDASFSAVQRGVQRSVFASGRAPLDRGTTRVGPIAIEVVEPLRTLRVSVNAPQHGVVASLEWHARTAVVEEPRMTITDGRALILDSTRLVQWGSWRGRFETEAGAVEVDGARGTRDRSWGVRPVGEPQGGAPAGIAGGGLFFVWGPVHFSDACTHVALFETPEGGRFSTSALAVPVAEPGGVMFGSGLRQRHATSAECEMELAPGTRWMSRAHIRYRWRDGAAEDLTFEPLLRFHMKGIGYFHPEWAHGVWHGDAAEHSETWKLGDLNPTDPTNFHVENVCRVRRGNEIGVGILEHLMLGPVPSLGLTGFVDVAP
jgi:hypothetical protein